MNITATKNHKENIYLVSTKLKLKNPFTLDREPFTEK